MHAEGSSTADGSLEPLQNGPDGEELVARGHDDDPLQDVQPAEGDESGVQEGYEPGLPGRDRGGPERESMPVRSTCGEVPQPDVRLDGRPSAVQEWQRQEASSGGDGVGSDDAAPRLRRCGDEPLPAAQPEGGHDPAVCEWENLGTLGGDVREGGQHEAATASTSLEASGDGAGSPSLAAEDEGLEVMTIEVNSEEDLGMQQVEEYNDDGDQVVLMAWDTGIPPWRRTYTVRDRWLKRGNDEGWQRRRHREWKSEHWRGSSPKRSRAKGKGKNKPSRMAKAKPKARPFSIWTARGRHDGEAEECEDEQDEVVEVDVEEEQPLASHVGPRPDNEPFTIENAMHLWREFLDMEDDGGLGYPEWALDRVRDTIENWPAEDVSILLAAHQQFMGLVMAQVAEIAQRRIARAREENARPSERDDTSLMQASRVVRAPATGISTFGLELQFMTDELAAMDVEKARVRSSMLRGLLARRYGCASGRQAMGTRAMALEAAAVAFDDGDSAVESKVPEAVEDRQWGQRWWKRLLGPMVEEERQLREKRAQSSTLADAETVEESLESVDEGKGKEDARPDIDARVKRQVEEEDAREKEAWEKERQAKELLEYERDRAEQEKGR